MKALRGGAICAGAQMKIKDSLNLTDKVETEIFLGKHCSSAKAWGIRSVHVWGM